MRVTRRWWILSLLAVAFAVFAALLQTPLYLGGTILIAGYVLTAQLAFLTHLTHIQKNVQTQHRFTPTTTLTDTPVEHTASLTLPTANPCSITAILEPPRSWQTDQTRQPLEDALTLSQSGSFSVAGTYHTPGPRLELTDSHGLYTETLAVGTDASITVEPSTPRDIRVFAGTQQIGAGIGEHAATHGTGGLEPGELREYLPGDPTSRIDWNATARLGDPHIREFDAEADRDTLLFVDHRSSLASGPPGRTQFDYLREVALWFVEHAATYDDPLALYTIADTGITNRSQTQTGTTHYRHLRHVLHDLTPTTEAATSTPSHHYTGHTGHHHATQLTDDSEFATTLSPYFEHAESYVERVHEDPLFQTVTTTLGRTSGTPMVVILTNDTNRAELHETVRAVRRRDAAVTVFITPNALFTPDGITDAETAYAAYTDFLDYRSNLQGQQCTPYEVGPGDKLTTILQSP